MLVTGDDALLDELLRLAAAAGVELEVAHHAQAALRAWAGAPLVLVGADLAEALGATRPPRRDGVHLVAQPAAGSGSSAEVFRSAVAVGAETVAELPASQAWVVETLTDAGDGGAGRGRTVGVVAGAGGSGASTLVGALGLSAAREAPTLVVDADPAGPGVDRVLGLDRLDGARWDALGNTPGRLSARSLRESLPGRDGLSVLTWGPGPDTRLPEVTVREVLSAGSRGHATVLVDLPRHPDPVAEEVLSRCDDVVVITRVSVPALAAAGRVVPRVAAHARAVHLVTRGGANGVPPEEASGVLGVPLLAAMADQRGLTEAVDLGAGPLRSARGPLARACRTILSRLAAGRQVPA